MNVTLYGIFTVLPAIFGTLMFAACTGDDARTPKEAKPAPDLVAVYRAVIVGQGKSWVLFSNGTCFVLMQPGTDLRQQAIDSMREWGPVEPGGPGGDFAVTHLSEYPGYIVTGGHPDMLVYVSPEDAGGYTNDMAVGLLGRAIRDRDAHELRVVHVEDKRSHPAR